MGIKERALKRRKKIVAHRATSFKDAEDWDLEFWQNQTPEERLSALVALRRDVLKAEKARKHTIGSSINKGSRQNVNLFLREP